jgi:hypothetical protein
MPEYWLSFATDEGFRGYTVVEAVDEAGAVARANELGRNPGGEIAILEIPSQAANEPDI